MGKRRIKIWQKQALYNCKMFYKIGPGKHLKLDQKDFEILWAGKKDPLADCLQVKTNSKRSVACTINIYDRRFYDHNDIGLYYNTLERIVIDDPSLS